MGVIDPLEIRSSPTYTTIPNLVAVGQTVRVGAGRGLPENFVTVVALTKTRAVESLTITCIRSDTILESDGRTDRQTDRRTASLQQHLE